MNCTASSYFIPLSMRAKATKTGALRRTIQRTGEIKKRWREEQKIKSQSSHGYKVIHMREKGGEGVLNLGKKPGKPTGVRRFTNALLGQ